MDQCTQGLLGHPTANLRKQPARLVPRKCVPKRRGSLQICSLVIGRCPLVGKDLQSINHKRSRYSCLWVPGCMFKGPILRLQTGNKSGSPSGLTGPKADNKLPDRYTSHQPLGFSYHSLIGYQSSIETGSAVQDRQRGPATRQPDAAPKPFADRASKQVWQASVSLLVCQAKTKHYVHRPCVSWTHW